MVLVNNWHWYIPAGVFETIWFLICFILSWRLVRSLESCDKQMDKTVYVRSDTTQWEGWTKIR